MSWMSMRRSVPCVLRHHGDAANDADFKARHKSVRQLQRSCCLWCAVLLFVVLIAAMAVAYARIPNVSRSVGWRGICLIGVLGRPAQSGEDTPNSFCACRCP